LHDERNSPVRRIGGVAFGAWPLIGKSPNLPGDRFGRRVPVDDLSLQIQQTPSGVAETFE
jgi:hypothetical protein